MLTIPAQRRMTNRVLWTCTNNGGSFSPTQRTIWSLFVSFFFFFSKKALAIFWEEGYLLMFLFHCRDVKILLQYSCGYWLHFCQYLDKLIFPFLSSHTRWRCGPCVFDSRESTSVATRSVVPLEQGNATLLVAYNILDSELSSNLGLRKCHPGSVTDHSCGPLKITSPVI